MSALLSLTFGDPFTKIAALNDDWPQFISDEHSEILIGRAQWAASYWEAANNLYGNRDVTDSIAFAGPIMQNTGLACELTLKCLLSGGGYTDAALKKLGHSLSALYDKAENFLDIYRFLDAVQRASQPFEVPKVVEEQLTQSGQSREEADLAWRDFSPHIRLLDESYDRPFRARFVAEGPIRLPEPFIILLGSLILLNAMRERLELPVVGTLLGKKSGPSGLV